MDGVSKNGARMERSDIRESKMKMLYKLNGRTSSSMKRNLLDFKLDLHDWETDSPFAAKSLDAEQYKVTKSVDNGPFLLS